MNKKPIPSPQHGPAAVLLELITEYPELTPLRWTLGCDGHLMGNALDLGVNVRPLMAAYMDVLGAVRPLDVVYTPKGGEPQFSSWVHVVWRDVPLSITLSCAAALTEEQPAGVPVSLPTEWCAAVAS